MSPRTSEHQLERARRLRREQTEAEEILWRSLRDRQLGAKVRRQVPVGAFVVDFARVEAKLVVEVDGPSHETPAGRAADAWRDRCLSDSGRRVVRVTNALVIGGGDPALAPISRRWTKGHHDARPSPSRREGRRVRRVRSTG